MRATAFKIRQKLFNKKYCNVGMTQQWPLARNQTYDVGLIGHWPTKKRNQM